MRLNLASLERAADGSLAGFTQAVFEAEDWLEALRLLFARPGFAARALGLLQRSKVGACRALPDRELNTVELLGQHLGEAAFAPAFDLLSKLHRHHPEDSVRTYVGHGLFHFGPRGLDALAGKPGSEPGDSDSIVNMIRMKAAIVRADSFEQLTSGSASKRLGVLEALHQLLDKKQRARDHLAMPLALRGDPRWPEWIADQLNGKATQQAAQTLLNFFPKDLRPPVVGRRRKGPQAAAKRQHDRPPPRAAIAGMDRELRAMRKQLGALVDRLRRQKYEFVAAVPLEKPDRGFAVKLRKLELRVGPVPASLARFWAVVGAIDLRGNHPAWARKTWLRASADEPVWYADPLQVISLAGALRDAQNSEFDLEDALPKQHYALTIGGDEVTKANYSGGAYAMLCNRPALDARVQPTRRAFLEHLRHGIAWSGFPGFERIKERGMALARPRAASR
jgi:hypothetical protein